MSISISEAEVVAAELRIIDAKGNDDAWSTQSTAATDVSDASSAVEDLLSIDSNSDVSGTPARQAVDNTPGESVPRINSVDNNHVSPPTRKTDERSTSIGSTNDEFVKRRPTDSRTSSHTSFNDNDYLNDDDKDAPPRERRSSSSSVLRHIVDDFTPNKGDQKILRAIGRTATVNAAVLITAATGGAAAAGGIGFATGGAITSKRLFDGLVAQDDREVNKSMAVYTCATGASIAGQAIAGALMIGLAGASLPLAAAVAFGVGCCSGITAGALSEWVVDGVMDVVGANSLMMGKSKATIEYFA